MARTEEITAGPLGDLETEVMKVVWRLERTTVQEVLENLEYDKRLAYTTVMTVLSRLAAKGFLHRVKEGRGFVYTPAVDRERVATSALRSVVGRFFGGLTSQAVEKLISEDEGLDDGDLDALEELIRQKRAARG